MPSGGTLAFRNTAAVWLMASRADPTLSIIVTAKTAVLGCRFSTRTDATSTNWGVLRWYGSRLSRIGQMSTHAIDTVLRVRLLHRPGQLALFATALGDLGALIGDIITVHIGEGTSVRDITIETIDESHTERVLAGIAKMDGVTVQSKRDLVFECHRGGKIHSSSRVELRQLRDLRNIYTPGVARVAQAIKRDPEHAWELTGLGNSVGIFTNGSRVLGLGNIGPLASLPVMEGKAVLYDKFVGISATPILIDTLEEKAFIETVVRISRTFGGIHLEDIRVPECFRIESELDRLIDKPVMHDDQHGTATVALAAIINACRLTNKKLKGSRLGQIGLGAAGSAIARLALAYGVENVLVTDVSNEAVTKMEAQGARGADLQTLMRDADIVVATTGKPGLIAPRMIRQGQVIFALSNPIPEITPEDAKAAGAAFAADGQSINNALAFPGLFKGTLNVRSRAIRPEMLITAAETIAHHADHHEVVPSPLNLAVHRAVAKAVSECAQKIGLAGTAKL